jgi:hypothetical protein
MTMQTYRGSCHCGRVTFEAQAKLDYVVECNCSLCGKRGALWHGAKDADLKILTGEADLTLYQFGTKTARHYFCRHCGIAPLTRPRLDPTRWAFNVNCVEGVEASKLPKRTFDGQNWEAAAAAFQRR